MMLESPKQERTFLLALLLLRRIMSLAFTYRILLTREYKVKSLLVLK